MVPFHVSQPLGTLQSLWRYPVKSMGGEELETALVTFTGILGDRVCALLGQPRAPNKPWLTARQRPGLVRWHAAFGDRLPLELAHPELAVQALRIRAPDGTTFTPQDPAFAAHMQEAIGGEVGATLDPLRFRANCYVDWREGPFLEDRLVGMDLAIGEQVQVRVTKRDKRCKVITVDPTDAALDTRVLDTVVERHDACAG